MNGRFMEQVAGDSTAAPKPSPEETRQRFVAGVRDVQPRLHRFCARMCGSVLDGEDVVQETLAQAFDSLPTLTDESRLEP